MAAGRASRATISARGGTTGRAVGWPTKFGLAGGRKGAPPDIVPAPTVCEGGGADPGVGLNGGRAGIGIVGTAALGRGAPGVVIITGGAGAEGAACAVSKRRDRLARSRKNLSWAGRWRRRSATESTDRD